MVARTMECVRSGSEVCVAYYGHPGIFVAPSHKAIALARSEGYEARMLPAVSSLDCLFCDLGVDPATGCQILEATDLLLRRRKIDVHSHTVVWQIAATGDLGFSFKGYDGRNFPALVECLLKLYPLDHEVIVYEAAQYSVCEPTMVRVPLRDLPLQRITGVSTLYLPPKVKAPVYIPMLERLGLTNILKGKRLVPISKPL